jgi:histidinol-phosphate aminotransferase
MSVAAKPIRASERLSRVKRLFDPYQDRRDFVRLDRNEDPVGWTPEHFEAIRNSLSPYDLAAYADSNDLIAKLASWCGVGTDSILVTAGSDAGMKALFETYIDEDDTVVMQDPSWRMYEVYNNIYKGRALNVPYGQNLEFDIDAVLEHMRAARVRMTILANPNQPTGTLIDDAHIEAVIREGAERGTVVVMDEAYHLFTPRTAVGWVNKYPNLVVVRTFSKAFGLAGLRLGYCVANPERIRELSLLRPVTDSNSIALRCGEYALDHLDWVERRLADYIAGRDFLYRAMHDAGLETFPSHTNFVLVRCKSADECRAAIATARTRGYLLKGPWMQAPLTNCLRISTGPLELMQRFWNDCADPIKLAAKKR